MSHSGWDPPLTQEDYNVLSEALVACPGCRTSNFQHWGTHGGFLKPLWLVFSCFACDRVFLFRYDFLERRGGSSSAK